MRTSATALVLLAGAVWLGGAQFTMRPIQFFKEMTLETLHRGDYNLTDCLKELFTCWEVVRPDTICMYREHYESVCGTMSTRCTLEHGRIYENTDFPIGVDYCPV